MQVISGSSNIEIAKLVADFLNTDFIQFSNSKYPDGELKFSLNRTIEKEVIIIQSITHPINDNLAELLILLNLLKSSGAQKITIFIPYFGYSRQDKIKGLSMISIFDSICSLLYKAGADKIITLDIHSDNNNVINISTEEIFLNSINIITQDTIIIAPDQGSKNRAEIYSTRLNLDLAIIKKNRDKNDICHMNEIIGDVQNKECILIDDIIDSGGTICTAAELLTKKGAKKIIAIASHGVFSSDAYHKLNNSAIEKIYISNSILQSNNLSDKIKILPVNNHIIEKVIKAL